MIVKLYTETLDLEPAWVDLDIDQHSISAYWNVPAYLDGVIVVPSDEWNVVTPAMVMTIKECDSLLYFLKHKFEK